MKTDESMDAAGGRPERDWLGTIAAGRCTPADVERLRRSLAARPAEARQLEQELALDDLLRDRSRSPRPGTDFLAKVQSKVRTAGTESMGRSQRKAWFWHGFTDLGLGMSWLRGPAWAVLVVGFALGLGMGWRVHVHRHRDLMADSVSAVALTAAAPGLSAETLEDYDAIRRLGVSTQPSDEALIAALLEEPRP